MTPRDPWGRDSLLPVEKVSHQPPGTSWELQQAGASLAGQGFGEAQGLPDHHWGPGFHTSLQRPREDARGHLCWTQAEGLELS